jgi:hypothetical protein
MLRLAHRILTQTCGLYGPAIPPTITDADGKLLAEWSINKALRSQEAPVIVADNVAAYLDGSYIKWADVQPISPPFSKMLVVWRTAHYTGCCEHGVSLETTMVDDLDEEALDAAGIRRAFDLAAKLGLKYEALVFQDTKPQTLSHSCIVSAFCYCVDSKGMLSRSILPTFFTISRGCLLSIIEPDIFMTEMRLGWWCHPALTAVAFMNCKNVARLDVTSNEGPTPKWCRRQRVPELKYHALQIDPNLGTKPRPGERKTEGDRSGKSLHICRGHFVHYRDDGVSQGLFGRRQYGTFWVPAHTRGSLELGKVISSYNVKAPCST